MAGKRKHLCCWKREERAADFKKYRKIVRKSRYVCINCGRTAVSPEFLCQAASLKKDGSK